MRSDLTSARRGWWELPTSTQHEGNDIAAPLGAALVAVEPGMVVAMGTDRLGGIKLWLAGRSGTYYYYAHLSKFADDVHEGDIVPAGDDPRLLRQHRERARRHPPSALRGAPERRARGRSVSVPRAPPTRRQRIGEVALR